MYNYIKCDSLNHLLACFRSIQTPVSRRGYDSTPKSKSTFHTPLNQRLNAPHTESFTSTLETPDSVMKPTKSADILETIAIDGDNEKNENNVDRKETTKIKFVENDDHDQNYHTPISFKMNKFMMCFKSEPDLSRVQNGSEHVPILNRGRFIAKKLLSGVSMINLRRPFANSSEKATITTTVTETMANDVNKVENLSMKILEVSQNESEVYNKIISTVNLPVIITDENKIDDDDEDFVDDEEVDREYDDSVDKENRSPIQCKTIEYVSKLKSLPTATSTTSGCGAVLSDSIANDSVSPITKSTHRMSKAMQVSKLQIIIDVSVWF